MRDAEDQEYFGAIASCRANTARRIEHLARLDVLGQSLMTMVGATLLACASPVSRPPPGPVPRDDPTVAELDRMIKSGRVEQPSTYAPPATEAQPSSAVEEGGVSPCIQAVDQQGLCTDAQLPPYRIMGVRVALDPRYKQWPRWLDRLSDTFVCVNRFYQRTGIQWEVESLTEWDPGAQRHELYGLLYRLQRELPFDGRHLSLGITVWEERRIYATAGGEIGLSQRAACVVPSWPRVENDCLILTHELGHLIGAKHVPGKHWVMGWAASPFHLPSDNPLERVLAVYNFHPRNAEAIAAYRSAQMTPNGLVPSVPCRERIARLDACYGL